MAMGPPGTLAGSEVLDQPPPSPAVEQGASPGLPLIGDMLPTQASSQQMPPEVLTGIMQAATKIVQDLNSFAQATPDLASDWAKVQVALQQAMSKLLVAGSGPTSPMAPGPGFPGGGIDRGAMTLASGGLG